MMDNQFWMWLIGIIIVIFQAIQVVQQRTQNIYVKWTNEKIEALVKETNKLWVRINTHGHKIDCTDKDCKPKTTSVTIHDEG